jgi:pilus assembly protein CpaB
MTRRVMTILLVAFAVALGSSYLAYRLVRGTMARSAAAPTTTTVIVAKRNLDLGTMVQKADVGTAAWVGTPPKDVATREEDVIGRGVISALYEGEPIFESRLAKPGAGGGLAATIPPGMRACAVKVDQVVGMAGFVVPGMRVDVLIMGSPPGGTAAEGAKVKTVLQNVEVLSAGQNIQKDASGKPVEVQVVSLLVTPEQAEMLSLASNESKIQLVLRNPLDTESSKTGGSTMASLFSGVKPATAAPARAEGQALKAPMAAAVRPPKPAPALTPVVPPPAPYLIELINGARKDQSKFNKAEEKKSDKPEEAKQ